MKGSSFPDHTALVKVGNEVKYTFDNLRGFCSSSVSIPEKVMQYALEHRVTYAMHILESNISMYIVDVKGNLKVLDLRDGNLRAIQADQFVDCCWDDLFPH